MSVYVAVEKTFIDNVNFPNGGALGYIGASARLWFHVLNVALSYIGNVLCDFILVRCRLMLNFFRALMFDYHRSYGGVMLSGESAVWALTLSPTWS